MTGAEAKDEAPGKITIEAGDSLSNVVWCRVPDADNAAGHWDGVCGGQKPAKAGGQAGMKAARHPYGRVAQLFHLAAEVTGLSGVRAPRTTPPDTDLTKSHWPSLRKPAAGSFVRSG